MAGYKSDLEVPAGFRFHRIYKLNGLLQPGSFDLYLPIHVKTALDDEEKQGIAQRRAEAQEKEKDDEDQKVPKPDVGIAVQSDLDANVADRYANTTPRVPVRTDPMYKNYDIQTGEELKALFPYMFNKPHIGFTFYRGWMPILAGACIDIDRALGENCELFHWDQIKEKFGTARLYYNLGAYSPLRVDLHAPKGLYSLKTKPAENSDLQQTVSQLVHGAEQETRRSCMVCGGPASPESYGGYFMTLCGNHYPDSTRSPNDLRREAVQAHPTHGKPGEGS